MSVRAIVAGVLIVLSLAVLEYARWGVQINSFQVGQTPVTEYALRGADGPVVVVAHGFAGSQQMMQGYALPLAQAGYRVFVFEFLGHGRNPVPMSGDVTSVDGTTRLLVDQTRAVIDAVSPNAGKVALLGHSMATDILLRAAKGRSDIGPMVLLSAFSNEITATYPANLLLVAGAWEQGLRDFGLRALRMVAPDAPEGSTVQNGPVIRRAVAAAFSEHISILYSRAARAEALVWLNQAYDRSTPSAIVPTGWAILGLLAGLVLLFRPIAALLAPQSRAVLAPSGRQMAALLILPALTAPLIAVWVNPQVLPVLVADYLGLHLFLYGLLQLAMLALWRRLDLRLNWAGFALLLGWCAVLGLGLDRYAANFWPTTGRLWIIAVLSLGAVPYMLADCALTAQAGLARRFAVRAGFLASLGLAVALDFKGLFFLLLIAPVMVLFYLVFGSMGREVSRRSGPMAAGLALGLVLAWALGVSFPLFQS